MAWATSDQPTPGSLADQQPEADPEQVARTIVLRRLALAPRTRSDLAKDLAKRGIPDDVIGPVLDRFEELGYIDDEAYAHMWVESRRRNKALARSVLKRELTDHGIDRELVDAAIAQIDDDAEWQRAREFALSKFRVRQGEEPHKAIQRLASQLGRKGYPAYMCFAVAREASAAVAEQREHHGIDQVDAGLIVNDFAAEQESV
jgi:regulatory protein